MSNETKAWLKDAALRAVKTVAQSAVAMIGTSAFLEDVAWGAVASAAALAGILSMLTSVASLVTSRPKVEAVADEGAVGEAVAGAEEEAAEEEASE